MSQDIHNSSTSKVKPPPPPTSGQMDFLTDSCVFKALMATVAGAGLGFAFGGFFGVHNPSSEELAGKGIARQVAEGFKLAGKSGWAMSKNFAMVGLLFSSTECLIEGYRAKTDKWNSLAAGCISGGILAARVGPKAMAFGCGTFAAFSYVIDSMTGRYDEAGNVDHD